jgi:thiamine biosynthesis lipoprotein
VNRREFGRLVAGSAAGFWLPGRAPLGPVFTGDVRVERWSWAMGQPVRLVLHAASEDAGYEVAQAVFGELRRIEARLSVFDDASDVAELNRRAGRGPVAVGPDLVHILAEAGRFEHLTSGAFNLAVEPLMRAWGFSSPRAAPPSARELREAEDAVRHATVELSGSRASLGASHAAVDTGGIAVGYALDRAAALLRAAGIRRALLDISGDCIALGAPPGERAWVIEIVDSSDARPVGTVPLRDAALATSANTVTAVHFGAMTVGHVMNPATGIAASALSQATVTAPTGIAADALSTAMLVSGLSYPRTTAVRTCAARCQPTPPAAIFR